MSVNKEYKLMTRAANRGSLSTVSVDFKSSILPARRVLASQGLAPQATEGSQPFISVCWLEPCVWTPGVPLSYLQGTSCSKWKIFF